jgi:hypothetical protein
LVADHVYGVLPPVAAKVWLYEELVFAAGSDAVVMRSCAATVSGSVAVACEPEASFRVMAISEVAARVGVPLRTPLLPLKLSGLGTPVADHV